MLEVFENLFNTCVPKQFFKAYFLKNKVLNEKLLFLHA